MEMRPLRILALDPGTATMGVSLVLASEDHAGIQIEYCRTHNAQKMLNRYPRLSERRDELTVRLYAHQVNLNRLIEWLEPDVIVAESPFFNPRRPSSSEPLARMKQILIEVSIAHDVDIIWIAPQAMKKAIGAKMVKGANTKIEIEKAIQTLIDTDQITFKDASGIKSLADIDEHSVDSIGIGYAYALDVFLNN